MIENEWPQLGGDWIGHYKSHFDEVVRVTQNGPLVEAVKVTGDDYVPAGEITWRADLRTMEGEGQVAEREFRQPRFVPGKLVVHSDDQLEFIWNGLGTVLYRKDD